MQNNKHSANRLTYALNATGKLVYIDEVQNGNKCCCFCPACKEPLIAKNQGFKRMHHFSHQSGTECDYAMESMLHLLAKEKIREAFLLKTEFWIEFEYKSFCSQQNECKFTRYSDCYESKRLRFDIKQYYDSCEQEKPYDYTNRRSDLKIFSSTHNNREPIYLEFTVTHASDLKKLHSGNKIIEIRINSEKDIINIVENGILEPNYYNICEYNDNNEINLQEIKFYGFKNKDYKNNKIDNEIEFVRYILYKSGKTQCFQDVCNCKNLKKSKLSSLLEICFHTSVSLGIYEQARYIGFQKYKIPNCILCKNYVDCYNGIGKICRMYKKLQISKIDKFDTARAKTCKYFNVDQEEMETVIKNGIDLDYTIL